jgi:hypothetical protein
MNAYSLSANVTMAGESLLRCTEVTVEEQAKEQIAGEYASWPA